MPSGLPTAAPRILSPAKTSGRDAGAQFSLILHMILSEKSATFRDHALGAALSYFSPEGIGQWLG
jgi:hypothetical protein